MGAVPVPPLLQTEALACLREALEGFTPDSVLSVLGLVGQSALDRGDLVGAERALPDGGPLATLVRLFLLDREVPEAAALAAVGSLDPGLFDVVAGRVRARFEVRPYGEQDGPAWWVVSDFGSDVRPGPLEQDHVLGIGAASLNLAQVTMRRPVGRALDVGTGCGIQALHLSRHADAVTATDLSARALAMAATTAALSGVRWELRQGSLLEPVAEEQYDLIVANPPFVVSPGLSAGAGGGYDYRDSGLAGDGVCHALVTGLPSRLAPDGTAQLLANWVITAEQAWDERLAGWLDGSGCDAWVWQREVAGPGEYVSLWLRDAGEQPGTDRWRQRYTEWTDWMAGAGIVGVGMGVVSLWNSGSGAPVVVCEDVPQSVDQPAGPAIAQWLPRQHWLRDSSDLDLLAAPLRCADGLVRVRHDLRGACGWQTELEQLRLSDGMRWQVEADAAIAGLVGACDGTVPLAVLVRTLATAMGAGEDEVSEAVIPVVRDLISRGILLPPG
jgi:methylase of polypeptide subunit release factors